jgi:hypothetical protein
VGRIIRGQLGRMPSHGVEVGQHLLDQLRADGNELFKSG